MATFDITVRVLCHGHAPHDPVVHSISLDDVSRFLSALSVYGGDEGGEGCIEAYIESYLRSATTYDLRRKLTPE